MASKKENADLRKLAYDCWMNRPKDSPYWNENLCKVIAEERLERKKNFFLSVNAGECKKSFWNPFAALKKNVGMKDLLTLKMQEKKMKL